MTTFKVKLMRMTHDYVTITVNEDDVTTADEATDFVNNQLMNPDFDPVEEADENSGHADVDEPFEVLDVEPADPPPAAWTRAAQAAAKEAGLKVRELRLSSLDTPDMSGLPIVDEDS